MKPALLVMDIQKLYFNVDDKMTQSLNKSLQYINVAIELFRAKGLPIICVQNIDKSINFTPECDDFDSPDNLKIKDSDIHIYKTYCNAFNKTDLVDELKKLNVDTLIITGLAAEYCVLSTYKAAADYDLTAIMLRGGLSSMNPENISFVERISDVISINALEKFIDNF